MRSFKTLLKEAILGNFEYDVPDAKDKRLFDFYMSTSFVKSHAIKSTSFTARNTEEIDYEIDRIKEKLYPVLKSDLIDTVFVCIFSEMKHFLDFCVGSATDYRNKSGLDDKGQIKVFMPGNKDIYSDLDFHPIFRKYIKEMLVLMDNEGIPEGYTGESGFEAIKYFIYKFLDKYNLTRSQLIRIAAPNFLNVNWPSQYGGRAWYNICRGWLGLNKAESTEDMMVWIDHIYDLQHNTNTVLDKSPDYAINGGYYWIKSALDFKKHIKDPKQLLPFVSRRMSEFAQIYMKSYRGIHTEDGPSFEEAAQAIHQNDFDKIKKYVKNDGDLNFTILEALIAKYKENIPDFNSIMSIIKTKEWPKNQAETLSRSSLILLSREIYSQSKTAESYSYEANANIDYLTEIMVLPDGLVALPFITAAANKQFAAVEIMLEMVYKKYELLGKESKKTLNEDILPYLYGKSLPEVQDAADYKQSVRHLADLTSEYAMEELFNYKYAISIMMSVHGRIGDIAEKVYHLWSYFGTTSDLNSIINDAKRYKIKSILDAEFVKGYIKDTEDTPQVA